MVDSPANQKSEAQSVVEDNILQKAVEAVDTAFPGLKCLRCGNDKFYLFHAQATAFRGKHTRIPKEEYTSDSSEMIDLICQRCGMVEKHLLPIVQKAKKPIPTD